MGHPDDDFGRPFRRREFDRLVEHGDQHVDPLDREALLSQVGAVQELLQSLHLGEAVERSHAILVGVALEVGAALHLVPQPRDFCGVLEVLELVAEVAAVDGLQPVEGEGERSFAAFGEEDRGGDLLQLLHGGAEVGGVELGVAGRRTPEGVDAGGLVAVFAERLQQVGGAGDEGEEAGVGGGLSGRLRRGSGGPDGFRGNRRYWRLLRRGVFGRGRGTPRPPSGDLDPRQSV